MANEITTSSVTAEELMEQAQTYASTWASVGGPFDDGNTLARAEEEKAKFWSLVGQLVQERDDYRTAEEHQIALRKKDQARVDFLKGHSDILKEQNDELVSHVEHLDGLRRNVIEAIRDDRFEDLDISFYRDDLQPLKPTTSLARRDALNQSEGMKKAALLIEQKADAYNAEHGTTDASTGAREYPGDGAEHYNELMELADDLRRQAEGSETQ